MESDLPSIPIFLPKQEDNSKFALFESVIGKYFEIIKGILPKISSLYLGISSSIQKMTCFNKTYTAYRQVRVLINRNEQIRNLDRKPPLRNENHSSDDRVQTQHDRITLHQRFDGKC